MITSPDELRKETAQSLRQINAMIKEVEEEAEGIGVPPHKMRDSSNNLILSPLLLAKVMAINTLVELNSNVQSRGRRSS